MTVQKGLLGHRYDDSEPLYFTTSGDLIWNRITKKWISFVSLEARRVAESADWALREIGIPSIGWKRSHLNMDFGWGPGLDDTSGLVSELVVNGEAWTDASGSTPPTSWTGLGTATYSLTTGVLTMSNPADGDDTLTQDLTTVVGTVYVLELGVGAATTPNAYVSLNGVEISIGGGAGAKSMSFKADSTTTELQFTIRDAGVIELDYARFYEEAELTGSGGAVMAVATTPLPPVVCSPEKPVVDEPIKKKKKEKP